MNLRDATLGHTLDARPVRKWLRPTWSLLAFSQRSLKGSDPLTLWLVGYVARGSTLPSRTFFTHMTFS